MSKIDKICAAVFAAVLLAGWFVWYRHSAATVEACLNNYEACAAAYYKGN